MLWEFGIGTHKGGLEESRKRKGRRGSGQLVPMEGTGGQVQARGTHRVSCRHKVVFGGCSLSTGNHCWLGGEGLDS